MTPEELDAGILRAAEGLLAWFTSGEGRQCLHELGFKLRRKRTLHPLEVDGQIRYFRTRARLLKFQRQHKGY